MTENAKLSQRDMMRSLYRLHSGDEAAVCAAFAKAERDGDFARKHNRLKTTPESYAKALLRDGLRTGWIP